MPTTDGTAPMTIRTAARMQGVTAYRRAADPAAQAPDLLRLDANEGPRAGDAIREVIARVRPDALRDYPDRRALEVDLSARFDIGPERVLVTAGGDDAIDRVCRATLDPGDTALVHTPTFEMVPRSIRLAGAEERAIPWFDEPFPAGRFLDAIDAAPKLVCIVSPNNPTGEAARAEDLVAIAASARRRGIGVMFDFAYIEFADADPTPDLLAFDNAMIVRTFSKAWGLAGLRVGYLLGAPDMIEACRAAGGPYPCAGTSLAVARERLVRNAPDVAAFVRRVASERAELAGLLEGVGGRPLSSRANFVLARVPQAAAFRDAMLRRGVLIRAFPNRPRLEDTVRITCPGNEKDFARLASALTEAAKEIDS